MPITYGIILYITTYAYQLIYDLEEQDIGNPGYLGDSFNRAESNGRFGIHVIGDLIYNGNSELLIYDNYIVIWLGCDS